MNILLIFNLLLQGALAANVQKVEVLIGGQQTQSVSFESKNVDGIDSHYVEFNTTQKKKIFRAVSKNEFENISAGYAKVREIFKTKGKVIFTEPCAEIVTVTSFSIAQNICIDKFGKDDKKRLSTWFKLASETAIGTPNK